MKSGKIFLVVLVVVVLAFVLGGIYAGISTNNDNSKIKKLDAIYEGINNLEPISSKDITTTFLVDDDLKEAFNQNEFDVKLTEYKTENSQIYNVIPVTDLASSFIIIKHSKGYAMLSVYSQGKGEEIYRYYFNKNNSIFYALDMSTKLEIDVSTLTNKNHLTAVYIYYTMLNK